MTVYEFTEWLKTQDQDAIVQIVYHERGTGYYDQGGTASVIEFRPDVNQYGVADHWNYTDYRNNRFVKETDPHYNKLYLLLGGYEE